MHTGERIKRVRMLRGLTQADLAEKINKTRPLISHIEQTGKVHPQTLREILTVLEIDEETLELIDESQIPYIPEHIRKKEAAMKEEIEQLKRVVELLERENQALTKLVETQDVMIKELRKKGK